MNPWIFSKQAQMSGYLFGSARILSLKISSNFYAHDDFGLSFVFSDRLVKIAERSRFFPNKPSEDS
jgi:hypothetical protein